MKRLCKVRGICTSALSKLRVLKLYPQKEVLHGYISPKSKYVVMSRVSLILPQEETGSEPVCGRCAR